MPPPRQAHAVGKDHTPASAGCCEAPLISPPGFRPQLLCTLLLGTRRLEGVEEERMLPLLRSLRSFISLGLLFSVPSWRHTNYGPGDATAIEVREGPP